MKGSKREGDVISTGAGITASAVWVFSKDVPRKDLLAAVLSIDGELFTFQLAPIRQTPAK